MKKQVIGIRIEAIDIGFLLNTSLMDDQLVGPCYSVDARRLDYEGGIEWSISIHKKNKKPAFCIVQLIQLCHIQYPI